MKILVTGAKGFAGRNLVENLKNIRDGKNKTHPNIQIDEIFEFDIDTDKSLLDKYCAQADFVFNLAGVNRPKDNSEFMSGNFGFASELLDLLSLFGDLALLTVFFAFFLVRRFFRFFFHRRLGLLRVFFLYFFFFHICLSFFFRPQR